MKQWLFIVLLSIAAVMPDGASAADDLADAQRWLATQSYDKAVPIYRRLAESGDPEAQMRLGEMYWFGEGMASDVTQAKAWFERSAQAGNHAAAASLAALQRRQTRGGEIAYWTASYGGEDLTGGEFACRGPELPDVSRTQREIIRVDRSLKHWRACYNRFVDNLYDALPPGKRIPSDVLDMMTPAEAREAKAHLETVYRGVLEDARRNAARVIASEDTWYEATERYVQLEHRRNQDVLEMLERLKLNK